MKSILYTTCFLILGSSVSYGSQKEEVVSHKSYKALHEEVKEKEQILKELEHKKPSEDSHFVTEQYKKYHDELKNLEAEAEKNPNLNVEEPQSQIAQKYNIFTEVYYQ